MPCAKQTTPVFSIYDDHDFGNGGVRPAEMLIGLSVSALVGYACIHFFLRFIARIGFLPFTIYRIALAAVILLVFI